MQKIAFAAFMLGVFATSPMARAEENVTVAQKSDKAAPAAQEEEPVVEETTEDGIPDEELAAASRDGMKMSELKAISGNFNIKIKDDMLVFEGSVPRKCAKSAAVGEVDASTFKGFQGIRVDMPACRQGLAGLTAKEKKDLVQVKGAFPAKTLASDVDGQVCLIYSENGDEAKCDAIADLKFVSKATRDAQLAKETKEKQDKQRHNEEVAFVAKVRALCKSGDFETLTAEIRAMESVLGDVTSILAKVEEFKSARLIADISNAKDADTARTAYEAYLETNSGGDTDEVTEAYLTRRFDLLKESISDGEKKHEAKSQEIRSYAKALQETSFNDKEHKGQVAWSYAELAGVAKDEGDLDSAAAYFTKAIDYVDGKEARKDLEIAMTNMFHAAVEECLAKMAENEAKGSECDKLAAKAKKHLDNAIAYQKKLKKSGDALAELQALQMKKIQTFGVDKASINVPNYMAPGYGKYNRAPGTYDAKKYNAWGAGQNKANMERFYGSGSVDGSEGASGGGGNNATGLDF